MKIWQSPVTAAAANPKLNVPSMWLILLSIVLLAQPAATAAAWHDDEDGNDNRRVDQRVRYDDWDLAAIHLRTAQQLQLLQQMDDVEILNCCIGVGPLRVAASPDAMDVLNAMGVVEAILHDNAQQIIDEEHARLSAPPPAAAAGNWFDDYQDYQHVNDRMEEFIATWPELVSMEQIGTSIEGRAIYAMTISGEGDPSAKPALCFNGCQHAREWISPMTVMYIAEHLLSGYGEDTQITNLLDSLTYYIIPIVNPDGYQYSWDLDRLWRKNRRDNGNGTFGVDLNRNWSVGWGGDGSSSFPGNNTYHGTAPFSEPETTALSEFIADRDNIVAHIDFHSFSQLVLWPYGYEIAEPSEPDRSLFKGLGETIADVIYSLHSMVYDPQPAYDLYIASGIATDWAWDEAGAFSWTIELRDNGQFGFILPPEQIIPTGEENFAAMLELSEAVAAGEAQFSFPGGLPELVDVMNPPTITFAVTVLAAQPIDPDGASLWYRFDDAGQFTEIPASQVGDDTFAVTLPSGTCGAELQYYLSVSTVGGLTVTSPSNAPKETYTSELAEITTVFADDFESDLGWTVDNIQLMDGAWERGVPIGGGDRGDPPNDADGSGQCYLTDNDDDDGNSDVDGGWTILTSPTMDASNDDAFISYYRWYSNTFGDNPEMDIFEVEVSDDNGQTWVELETVGPDGPEVDGGWFHRQFAIADIPGIQPSEQFRIRFTASDPMPGAVVEAGVDGVKLLNITCSGTPTPGDFDEDGDVDTEDLLALLGVWGACPDCVQDITGDGAVNTEDLLILLSNWG